MLTREPLKPNLWTKGLKTCGFLLFWNCIYFCAKIFACSFLLFCFETGTLYVSQAGFKFRILLQLQHPMCWFLDYTTIPGPVCFLKKKKKTLRMKWASEATKLKYAVNECLESQARNPAASTSRESRTYSSEVSSCALIHELLKHVTCRPCFSHRGGNFLMRAAYRRNGLFCSQLKGHGDEDMTRGAWSSGSYCIHNQEAETDEGHCSVYLLLVSPGSQVMGSHCLYLGWVFAFPGNTLTDTFRGVFPCWF